MNEDVISKWQKIFGSQKFNVEHALDIYASSFSTCAAKQLYDDDILEKVRGIGRAFHIYVIGHLPKIAYEGVSEDAGGIRFFGKVAGEDFSFSIPPVPGLKFVEDSKGVRMENEKGEWFWPPDELILSEFNEKVGPLKFNVKYIGQAYGKDGSRTAVDRLLKHETLQKISLKGDPEGHMLQVLLLELHTDNRVMSVFIPGAKNQDDGSRTKMGVDKLFGTTTAERVSLFEASLIRYFQPEYNKEFKDSFPSTNLKILQDCYDKDFLAVIAQICIDELPFLLCSEAVEPKAYHIITHDLQKESDRKAFLGLMDVK